MDEPNRITLLPEDLIWDILQRIPARFLVKTMVLDKDMSGRWMETHEVTLDQDEPEPEGTQYPFALFVEEFLAKRTYLVRLNLKFRSDDVHPATVQAWIRSAILLGVENLELVAAPPMYPHGGDAVDFLLPAELFTAENMKILKIRGSGFKIDTPPQVTLPKIHTLELQLVRFQNTSILGRIIGGCKSIRILEIDNPIRFLGFDNREATILNTIGAACSTLEVLRFDLHRKRIPWLNVNFTFTSLDKLSIQNPLWRDLARILTLCPKLRTLEVTHWGIFSLLQVDWSSQLWQLAHDIPKCMIETLQEVTLHEYSGSWEDFGFLVFLLTHGFALRVVRLHLQICRERERMEREIMVICIPRVSDCIVSFT